MNRLIRSQWGFTLVEMVMTVAIVGVLASAAMPLASLVSQRSKEQELRQSLLQIREAIDAHRRDFDAGRIAKGTTDSGYPKSLKDLTEGLWIRPARRRSALSTCAGSRAIHWL